MYNDSVGYFVTDKPKGKAVRTKKGRIVHSTLGAALSNYRGVKPVEKVTIYSVDVSSGEILDRLGTLEQFMRKGRVDWNTISRLNLQMGTYIQYRNKLDWVIVSKNENIDQETLSFLHEYVDFSSIMYNFSRFSESFLLEHPFDYRYVVLDIVPSKELLDDFTPDEVDYYLEFGKVTYPNLCYILKNSVFKKDVYLKVSKNTNIDMDILVNYADKLVWEFIDLESRLLTRDDFNIIFPHVKGTGNIEKADLSKVYDLLLMSDEFKEFDYKTFLYYSKGKLKATGYLDKFTPIIESKLGRDTMNILLNI